VELVSTLPAQPLKGKIARLSKIAQRFDVLFFNIFKKFQRDIGKNVNRTAITLKKPNIYRKKYYGLDFKLYFTILCLICFDFIHCLKI